MRFSRASLLEPLVGDGVCAYKEFGLTNGRENCLIKACAGAQTSVETGIYFGIGTSDKKSCWSISARLILSSGTATRHSLMKSFA